MDFQKKRYQCFKKYSKNILQMEKCPELSSQNLLLGLQMGLTAQRMMIELKEFLKDMRKLTQKVYKKMNLLDFI